MKDRLNARQRALLSHISAVPMSPAALAERLGTSAHGAAESASALVRRGLVGRLVERGHVFYYRKAQ